MENVLFLMPFIFISMIAIIILTLVSGAVIFFKMDRVIFDLKLLKDELSFQSQNQLEETSSFESLREELKILEAEMNKAFKDSQDLIEKKVESKILEMGIHKKNLNDDRWASFKEAFKQPSAQDKP